MQKRRASEFREAKLLAVCKAGSAASEGDNLVDSRIFAASGVPILFCRLPGMLYEEQNSQAYASLKRSDERKDV